MSYQIRLHLTEQSRLNHIDFENIPFGKIFSDHMFVADYADGQWQDLRIVPFGPIEMHPGNMALHYGQSIFEGMKATMENGMPVLFRPDMHARRMNASALRMCMPEIPEALFVEAVETLVRLDQGWIPPTEGSAMYIRPLMFATDNILGVKASSTYRFIIMTGPVGPYYAKPVRLITADKYVRAAIRGGTGEAKTAGNYAASLRGVQEAQARGYDQIIWMDSVTFRYIQEVGTMNIFFVMDGKIVTPATGGAILRGITRDSIIHILRDKGYEVIEKQLDIYEVIDAYNRGTLSEVFGSGTAAVIAHVSEITHRDVTMTLPPVEDFEVANMLKAEINGMRSGRIPDTYGWLHAVEHAPAEI